VVASRPTSCARGWKRRPGAPVAVAPSKSAEGEFALDTVGLAWRVGEARAVTAEHLPHLKAPWLEDAGRGEGGVRREIGAAGAGRLGIEARGFEHDVMLYAFLLDADPSGCALEEQARRRLDLQLGPAPEQHADITLELWKQLSPAVEARGMRKLYDEIELPLTRVLARMERTGMRIDPAELRRLSG
jgi:DNA polymerase-1